MRVILGDAIDHFYAGWFDGNPAHLKPAKDPDVYAIYQRDAEKRSKR